MLVQFPATNLLKISKFLNLIIFFVDIKLKISKISIDTRAPYLPSKFLLFTVCPEKLFIKPINSETFTTKIISAFKLQE